MSIRALHYITGDTPQSGFRKIGGSEDFPADDLPLLNNGAVIQERARREARNARQSTGSGFRQVSHVWEYQTGKYGCPVIINTVGVIGIGRPHAFSEYVAGLTNNVAEVGDPGSMMRGAERFQMLSLERFAMIPGQAEVPCPEEIWEAIAEGPEENEQIEQVDPTWLRTLLSHYWKQASIRAFSEDAPMTVRVNLGQFDEEDTTADIEKTIHAGKDFFSRMISPMLPRQVQNIASMAAGVNCGDAGELYSALEFDITLNMYEDETLQMRRPRELHQYRLNEGEMEFISQVTEGHIPDAVKDFFDRYLTMSGNMEADETQIPFMADYRVWYGLYCLDQLAKDSSFAAKAGLTAEENQAEQIRPARACFLTLRRLRNILGNEHRLNENHKNLVTELLAPLESAVLKTMVADMEQENAQPFLLRRNEMVDFHRQTLYMAPEKQVEDLIRLAVRDQQKSKAPQFVRCYPATPLRNSQADERNSRLLRALLPAVIRPLIESEVQRGTIENKYLDQLRAEEFADRWACLDTNEKTREALTAFLQEETEDPKKHFLLYKISLKYIHGKELFLTTMRHFSALHTRPDQRPEERRLKIAAYGAREYISAENRSDPQCLDALNHYYYECFQEYREHIDDMSDVIRMLGGDTTDVLKMAFEKGIKGRWLSFDETKAAIRVFGGEEMRYARKNIILDAYSDMLSRRRKEAVETKDAKAFDWLCEMTENSPWRNREDWMEEQHTENIRMLCEISEQTGEPIASTSMTRIREWLQEGSVQPQGVQRLQQYCERELQKGNQATADSLIPCFSRIDESCPELRKVLFDRASGHFSDGLRYTNSPFGTLISECAPDVIKAGRSLDDLYTENQEQVENYLSHYFIENTDLNRLISEQEAIPENTAFARSWREKVNDQFYNQQVELFNRQPNVERLIGLREEITRRGSRMNESLRAAYELLDEYGNMLETLAEKTEYDALADMGRVLGQINDLLIRAGDTRKKLCITMRDMTWPGENKAKGKSFRHGLCVEMMRGVLTDSERTGVGRGRSGRGCPDWHRVLNNLFSNKAELDEAIHKPYAEENLGILQRLLATVNNIHLMTAYGLDSAWEEDLILAIHQENDLKRYQSALARNRKMSDFYQMRFDGDGMVFSK